MLIGPVQTLPGLLPALTMTCPAKPTAPEYEAALFRTIDPLVSKLRPILIEAVLVSPF
jgi:hypothetical protein